MEKNRIFTAEQLKEIGTRTLDLILEAIDTGDPHKAKDLANRMYDEFMSSGDMYRNWVTGILSFMYRTYGTDVLEQAYREAFKISPMELGKTEVFGPDDSEEMRKIKIMAFALRGLGSAATIEEDDEKICVTMEPCGSGQRLVEKGGYGPPRDFARVMEPHRLTWGQSDFPIYCTHDAILGIMAIEQTGHPQFVAFPADPMASAGCRFCLYKDPDDIPEDVYTRVGMKKPERH
jgi:hypothetical protein